MSGLVGYGSSDEEDEDDEKKQMPAVVENSSKETGVKTTIEHEQEPGSNKQHDALHEEETVDHEPRPTPSEASTLAGPYLGPSRPSASVLTDVSRREQHVDTNSADKEGPVVRRTPSPPAQSYQEAMQALTLPTVPSFSIPPSPPPGTSSSTKAAAAASAADTRIAQFARLKQQGVHFNQRLASSSALKNPSLLGRLIASAGLASDNSAATDGGPNFPNNTDRDGGVNGVNSDNEPAAQYCTTLPLEIWNPAAFPAWAYKEQLEQARLQAESNRSKSRTRELATGSAAAGTGRSGVEFVKASAEKQ